MKKIKSYLAFALWGIALTIVGCTTAAQTIAISLTQAALTSAVNWAWDKYVVGEDVSFLDYVDKDALLADLQTAIKEAATADDAATAVTDVIDSYNLTDADKETLITYLQSSIEEASAEEASEEATTTAAVGENYGGAVYAALGSLKTRLQAEQDNPVGTD